MYIHFSRILVQGSTCSWLLFRPLQPEGNVSYYRQVLNSMAVCQTGLRAEGIEGDHHTAER